MGDEVIRRAWWVKHFSFLTGYITVGEVGVVVYADITVTCTREGGKTADVGGRVTGDVADTVAFAGYYLNGV